MSVEFYDVVSKNFVKVPEKNVHHAITKNNRYVLTAPYQNHSVVKFVKAAEAQKFPLMK